MSANYNMSMAGYFIGRMAGKSRELGFELQSVGVSLRRVGLFSKKYFYVAEFIPAWQCKEEGKCKAVAIGLEDDPPPLTPEETINIARLREERVNERIIGVIVGHVPFGRENAIDFKSLHRNLKASGGMKEKSLYRWIIRCLADGLVCADTSDPLVTKYYRKEGRAA